jgi:hypothetical protein
MGETGIEEKEKEQEQEQEPHMAILMPNIYAKLKKYVRNQLFGPPVLSGINNRSNFEKYFSYVEFEELCLVGCIAAYSLPLTGYFLRLLFLPIDGGSVFFRMVWLEERQPCR